MISEPPPANRLRAFLIVVCFYIATSVMVVIGGAILKQVLGVAGLRFIAAGLVLMSCMAQSLSVAFGRENTSSPWTYSFDATVRARAQFWAASFALFAAIWFLM